MRRVCAKEEACMGCGLCRVFCQVEHSRSKDLLKAFLRESPKPVARVRLEKKGEVSFALQCRHCEEPACVYACLTGAMQKDPETGVVTSDPERCMGCWTCILACPYGAITRSADHESVVKCDLCPGLEVPACVANCPNEALVLYEDGDTAEASRSSLASVSAR